MTMCQLTPSRDRLLPSADLCLDASQNGRKQRNVGCPVCPMRLAWSLDTSHALAGGLFCELQVSEACSDACGPTRMFVACLHGCRLQAISHACICIHVDIYIYICICIHSQHTHSHTHTHIDTYTYIDIYTRIKTCINMYIYRNIHATLTLSAGMHLETAMLAVALYNKVDS
jgi:hypothetical protein